MQVIYEDEGIVVVVKPAGIATQPDKSGATAFSDLVAAHVGGRIGISHRLDLPVSGLLAFGKSKNATAWLDRCLRQRTAARAYIALIRTGNEPVAMQIDEPLLKLRDGYVQTHATGRPARTDLMPLAFDKASEFALVAVRLHTGRMHQARVHLSWAVGAVAGDRKYGDAADGYGRADRSDQTAERGAEPSRIALHAAMLRLPSQAKQPPRVFASAPPPDFWLGGSGRLAESPDVMARIESWLLTADGPRTGRSPARGAKNARSAG